jgi:hypothetical protein
MDGVVMRRRLKIAALTVLCWKLAAGCSPLTCDSDPNVSYVLPSLEVYSFPIDGSGQGLQLIGDRIYLYGDGETGIIQELDEELRPTGWTGALTYEGSDLIPHPTGIAFLEGYPTFIGYGGVLYEIDWNLFLEDGDLDRALLHTVSDDEARRGTRPEYVFYADRWYVATCDYDAPEGNEVRLMDPERLQAADATSDDGVVVHRFPVSPFVQDLHWSETLGQLVLVQNIGRWKGWKLTVIDLDRAIALNAGDDEAVTKTVCIERKSSELEGFAALPDGRELLLTANASNNLFVGSGILF